MIPTPQHNDPFASQKFRSRSIADLSDTIVVSAAVQLHRKLCGRTIEIEYVAVQGMLTTKFVTCKISIPETPPKNALSVGCLLSQQTSAIHEDVFRYQHYFPKAELHPSPQSSPRSRGEADECIHNAYSAAIAVTRCARQV